MMLHCHGIDTSRVSRYIPITVASRDVLPRTREATKELSSPAIPPALREIGKKTMSVKHASDLATRLSITAGATLAATYIVALALTAAVF